MPCQVNGKTKEERSRRLIELSNENEKQFLDKYINKDVQVLFEKEEKGYFKGHTTNYMVVNVKGNNLDNKIFNVRIINEKKLELEGKI